ncbi:MAG: hypothetical protein SWK76_16620 [Actinomycetota bacterium]|nr:hypothetical protein [Actinomycetota bacterium]
MPSICRECGVPKIISRTHSWRDGCITNKGGGADFSLYEVSFHNTLIEEVGKRLGVSIDWIVYIAGRHAAARIVRDMLAPYPRMGKLIFKRPLFRLGQRFLLEFARAIGMGDIELIEHVKWKRGSVRITNPFHLAHCTAVILGGLDVMYGFPVAFTAGVDGDSYIGELLPGEKDDIGSEDAFIRLTTDDLTPGKQDEAQRFTACSACGAPAELGERFLFDLEGGIITDRESGERFIFYGHHSLNTILREFEKELGRDIGDLFMEVEKESFAAKLEGSLGDRNLWDEEEMRRYLALQGLGTLTALEKREDNTYIEVANAFVTPLVAGRLAALWEREHVAEGNCTYQAFKNTLRLTITAQ